MSRVVSVVMMQGREASQGRVDHRQVRLVLARQVLGWAWC